LNDTALFIAVFLACVVEAVEATTIVVAAGATRSWRSAVLGVIAGVLVLAVAVSVAGPAISLLPIGVLRLVVGGLLLVFGLQWMRKAILRASGYKPLHDETAIYQKQVAAAQVATTRSRFGVSDWYAFTLSFKGVVLEGLEVVFIVLTSFGVFWGAEGAGAHWPGSDLSLLVVIPAVAVFALLIVVAMRARRAPRPKETSAPEVPPRVEVPAEPTVRPNRVLARLKAFGLFWYDFVIGDDWQIAAGVALGLAVTFALSLVSSLAWIIGPVIVVLLLPWGIRRALR
jgi:uncharacterized membrane protein